MCQGVSDRKRSKSTDRQGTRWSAFGPGFFFYEPYPITEDNFNIYKEKIWSSLGQFTPSVSEILVNRLSNIFIFFNWLEAKEMADGFLLHVIAVLRTLNRLHFDSSKITCKKNTWNCIGYNDHRSRQYPLIRRVISLYTIWYNVLNRTPWCSQSYLKINRHHGSDKNYRGTDRGEHCGMVETRTREL